MKSVFLIFFSFLFLLIVQPVSAQTYQTSQSMTTDVGKPTVGVCANANDCIGKLRQFGINLGGSVTDVGAQRTYEVLSLMSQKAPNFIHLLKLPNSPIAIRLHSGGCAGHASSDVGLDMYGTCRSDIGYRFILMHELGHMVAFRNPSLFAKFYNAGVWYRSILPTWNCQLDYGPYGPYAAECWADMIGQYPTYQQFREVVNGAPSYRYAAFPDFPTFANGYYYGFARSNIFITTM